MRFSTTTPPPPLQKDMVFSSVPAYLDHPSNWQHQIIGSGASTHLLPPHATPPPPPQQPPHGAPGSSSIRPGSMSERARQANIPMPESALKCPRCDSTNTKFCYFNNYSLTQPRHFCKTCRRYWTRGGALRSVPVGGGCRRNKRSSKSTSSSKSSPASSDGGLAKPNPGSSTTTTSGTTTTMNCAAPNGYSGGLFQPLRFMSPLSQLSEGFAGDIMSMNGGYGGNNNNNMQATSDYLQMGGFPGASNLLGLDQWKMQQFPFLGGLDPSPQPPQGAYQFPSGGELGFLGGELRPKISSSLLSQLASVKMEESKNSAELSLMSRELLGGMQGNDGQWNMNGAGAGGVGNWGELSSFSSSTSNHLQ